MTIYSTMVAGRNEVERADVDAWLDGVPAHQVPSRRAQMREFLQSDLGSEGLPEGVTI